MTILTPAQLATCWQASADAHRDSYDGGTHAREGRLAIIPAADHDTYLHAYQTAYAAIGEGHGIHTACTMAEDAIREWSVLAGIP